MRRTRKWSFVAQEATRLAALGLSPSEIAKRLEVNRSTVTRWKAAGKLPQPAASAPEPSSPTSQAPSAWAKTVRETYSLDATDDQLVTLAEVALAMSLDQKTGPAVRMTAAGRYQALVRQLALVARGGEKETPAPGVPQPAVEARNAKNPVVRRPAGDPRKILMAVK